MFLREIAETGVDLFMASYVLQDVADAPCRAHCNRVSRIELGIVEI
jgi:hypothetical protein